MKFIKYNNKDEFLSNNIDILIKEEAKNEIMIGIVLQHDYDKTSKWLLGRIENDSDVEAIFIVDDDKEGLIVYFPKHEAKQEVVEMLIENIVNLKIELKEILSSTEYSKKLAETYIKKTDKKIINSTNTYIFKLEKLCEEIKLDEDEKIIKLDEEVHHPKKLTSLVKEIHTDIYEQEECSDEEALRIAKIYIKKGIFLLTNNDESKIYSQVVHVRKQINGAAIGAVITPKEYRGRGYAKKCIYGVCKILLKNNKFVVLHVDKNNNSAISVYKKIGFETLCETSKTFFA